MKYTVLIAAVVIAFSTACEKKEKPAPGGMEVFHEVMAESWHPVGDSGNFEPARRLAADLEQKARDWSAAAGVQESQETTAALALLVDSCAAFRKAVDAGRPDSLLRPTLAEIHHIFHRLHESKKEHKEAEHN